MRENRSLSRFFRRNAAALLCAAGLFTLVYLVVFNFRLSKAPDELSDYNAHLLWAIGMSTGSLRRSFYNGTRRLWHVFFRLTFLLVPNAWKAAAIVTAAADTAAYLVLFHALTRALPERSPRWLLALLCLCPFTAEALMLPGGTFYWSERTGLLGGLNAWHNPTNIMVRPFALAVFFMTADIYSRRRCGQSARLPVPEGSFAFPWGFWHQFLVPVFTGGELVLYPVCLLCSMWAKPSFIQVFAPAIFLLLIIDMIRTKGKLLPFCIKLSLAYLPAALLLLRQFPTAFGGELGAFVGGLLDGVFDAGTDVADSAQTAAAVASAVAETDGAAARLAVYYAPEGISGLGQLLAHIYSDWKPIVLFCAFPLFLLFISPRQSLSDPAMRLGALCVLIGRAEEVLLHETGSRATDGNFKWGFMLACLLLWAAAMGQYALLLREKSRRGTLARVGGTALLAWHMAAGVGYIAALFHGANYLI